MPARPELRSTAGLLAIAAVAALAGGGCSLLVSTSDLAAAGPSGDAGAGETRSDEASTTTEGGTTTDSGGDPALAPFCVSQNPKPKFCADFDTGSLLQLGTVEGTVTLDTAVSKSPPRSMSCEVSTTSAKRNGQVVHPFNEVPRSYDLSFDVYVDVYDVTHGVELITVAMQPSAETRCVTDVAIRDGVWAVDESCETNNTQVYGVTHASVKRVELGRWVHVDTSVSLEAARTLSLTVDGQSLFSATPLNAGLMAGNVTLQVGIVYTQLNATTAKVHFDNVRFDYR